jgi:hypothetical protein
MGVVSALKAEDITGIDWTRHVLLSPSGLITGPLLAVPLNAAFPEAYGVYVQVNVVKPPFFATVAVTGTGPVCFMTLPSQELMVGVVDIASARPLLVTRMITVMTWPMETCGGMSVMSGAANTGAGVCTITPRGAAVAETGNKVLLSGPEALAVNWMLPAPFAVYVHENVTAAPAVSVALTGETALNGPITAVPNVLCQPIDGTTLSPAAVPVFVTVIYTV